MDILFKDVKKFFKRQDGKPRQADIFRGSECLTNQQVDEEFLGANNPIITGLGVANIDTTRFNWASLF